MKYTTKKALVMGVNFLSMIVAALTLGWMYGHDDAIKGIKELADTNSDKPDEKPAIEWAEGGEEEFYKALEEADKEDEKNESKE